jgi:hypothetical protein
LCFPWMPHPSSSPEVYRMLYRWGCRRCVGGISPPAGREGPIIMFVSDVNIQPNRTGLPGIASLESIVGALLTFGLVAAVAGIAISAIAWAIGSHSGNPHVAGKGKSGVLVALAAAFLIGGSTFLVNFFNTQGGLLS